MTTDKNLDIFIISHKDFTPQVTNPCYKVLSLDNSKVSNTSLEQISVDYAKCRDMRILNMRRAYSELIGIMYVYNHVPLKKYVGFCHYRRYPMFMDNIPDIDQIFNGHDIMAVDDNNDEWTMYDIYRAFHNRGDLELMTSIITEWYPNQANGLYRFLSGHKQFMYNMFIMKSEDFIAYVRFLDKVFDMFDYRHNFNTDDDILWHVKTHPDEYHLNDTVMSGAPNSDPVYQSRIQAFLSERVFSQYLMNNFKNPFIFEANITENIYKNEK